MITISEISRQTGIKYLTIYERLQQQNIKPIGKQGKKNLYELSALKKATVAKRPINLTAAEKQRHAEKTNYARIVFAYLNANDKRPFVLAYDLKIPKLKIAEVIKDYNERQDCDFIILESKMNNNPNL